MKGLLIFGLIVFGIVAVIMRNDEAARQRAQAAAAEKHAAMLQDKHWLATPAGRICAKHQDWDVDACELIAKKQINWGMTEEQVAAAWGRPQHVNTDTTQYHTHDQWVYGENTYVYFDDGKLTSSQNAR